MLEALTGLLIPALLLAAGAAALSRKLDAYQLLLDGSKDGLRLMLTLTPTLVLMLSAVTMLRESGFFTLAAPLLAPVFRIFGIPAELAPLVLIRPFSGSAALAVGTDLMRQYGVDSTIGRTAAVRRRQHFTRSASISEPPGSKKRATPSPPRWPPT